VRGEGTLRRADGTIEVPTRCGMDCREFRETFSDYVDGLLAEADEIRGREHLGGCVCCRRFEHGYRAGVRALQGIPTIGPSRDLRARILHRIRRQPALPIVAGSYGFAGALLAVTFAGLLVLDLRGREATPAPDATVLVEQLPASPTFDVDSGADLITVRLVRDDSDLLQSDPYAPLSPPDPFASSRVRFVVPAVWSGR
jgi:hypothetical protein